MHSPYFSSSYKSRFPVSTISILHSSHLSFSILRGLSFPLFLFCTPLFIFFYFFILFFFIGHGSYFPFPVFCVPLFLFCTSFFPFFFIGHGSYFPFPVFCVPLFLFCTSFFPFFFHWSRFLFSLSCVLRSIISILHFFFSFFFYWSWFLFSLSCVLRSIISILHFFFSFFFFIIGHGSYFPFPVFCVPLFLCCTSSFFFLFVTVPIFPFLCSAFHYFYSALLFLFSFYSSRFLFSLFCVLRSSKLSLRYCSEFFFPISFILQCFGFPNSMLYSDYFLKL